MKTFIFCLLLACCFVSNSNAQTVIINSSDDTVCKYAPVTLSVSGAHSSFVWNAAGFPVSYGPSVVATPAVNTTYTVTQTDSAMDWAKIGMGGGYHSLNIKKDGSLWAWGANQNGQLGNGLLVHENLPIRIGTDTTWVKTALGMSHSLGLKTDGTLWAWGFNEWGQVGDGTILLRVLQPKKIGSSTQWIAISGGYSHTLALQSDGTLWAWGINNLGQLGDGTVIQRNIPVKIGTDTNWVTISAGYYHSMGIKKDGSLWAWGHNGSGRLGDGSTTQRNSPVRIGNDTTWLSISAGGSHSIAIKKDGSLWAWGYNSSGQLGDGTSILKSSPVQIGIDTGWKLIVAAQLHSVAIKKDGTLWAWGDNTNGQLGDSSLVKKLNPVQIGSDSSWLNISGGYTHTIALKKDEKIWTWGGNSYWQLGRSGQGRIPKAVMKITTGSKSIVTEKFYIVFTAGIPPSQCLGKQFELKNTSSVTSGTLSHFWDFGNGTISVLKDPNVNYNIASNYVIKLISTNTRGCKDSATMTVTVKPKPVTAFTINKQQQCLTGNQFIITDASSIASGTLSYLWDFGDGSGSSLQHPTHSYANGGSYNIKLTATSNSCSDTLSETVFIPSIPPQEICLVTVDSFTGKNMIIWERSAKLPQQGYNIYKESNVSNVYANIGFVSADSLGVFIDTLSNPGVKSDRYKILPVTDTCTDINSQSKAHKTLHLSVSPGSGNSWNLQWESYDGLPVNTIHIYRGTSLAGMSLLTSVQGSIHSYTDLTAPAGVYYYMVAVDFGIICDPSMYHKRQYSITTSNIVQNIKTGIPAVSSITRLSMFPNPTSGLVNLQFETSSASIEIEVQDVSGKSVYHSDAKHTGGLYQHTMDLSFLDKGVYLAKINTGQGNKNVKLVIR
ncbi:MAG: PKD domain-containing protein [Bacteroidota bacterium]